MRFRLGFIIVCNDHDPVLEIQPDNNLHDNHNGIHWETVKDAEYYKNGGTTPEEYIRREQLRMDGR